MAALLVAQLPHFYTEPLTATSAVADLALEPLCDSLRSYIVGIAYITWEAHSALTAATDAFITRDVCVASTCTKPRTDSNHYFVDYTIHDAIWLPVVPYSPEKARAVPLCIENR